MPTPKDSALRTLYNSLKADNYDVPDNYEDFEYTLNGAKGSAQARQDLYTSLRNDNYDVPNSYDDFEYTLFEDRYSGAQDAAQPKGQVQQPQAQPKYVHDGAGADIGAITNLAGAAPMNPVEDAKDANVKVVEPVQQEQVQVQPVQPQGPTAQEQAQEAAQRFKAAANNAETMVPNALYGVQAPQQEQPGATVVVDSETGKQVQGHDRAGHSFTQRVENKKTGRGLYFNNDTASWREGMEEWQRLDGFRTPEAKRIKEAADSGDPFKFHETLLDVWQNTDNEGFFNELANRGWHFDVERPKSNEELKAEADQMLSDTRSRLGSVMNKFSNSLKYHQEHGGVGLKLETDNPFDPAGKSTLLRREFNPEKA